MANKLNFIKKSLDALKTPEVGKRVTYYDTKVPYLALRVSSTGRKSFLVSRKIKGKSEKITLGAYPAMTIEQARKQANELNGLVASGSNPCEAKRQLKAEMSLGELFEVYMNRYAKIHKSSWPSDQAQYECYLTFMAKNKLSKIKKVEIQKLHANIGKNKGIYAANRLLALLSKLFSCAIDWGYMTNNPAKGIKKFKEKSRDRFLQSDEMPRLFKALHEEPNTVIRDYLLISLLVGARRSNVLAMRWDEINFDTAVWHIPKTKNGESLSVPLATAAIEILKTRKLEQLSPWVFPSKSSKSGHLQEPKSGWKRILQRANIENLRIHDLRRSLGSWQAATGANLSIIGRTLGHKNVSTTAIYARLNLDPVRESVEAATKAIIDASNTECSIISIDKQEVV